MYPPGPSNTGLFVCLSTVAISLVPGADGQPKDILGKDIKYSCHEPGCKNKRKMGYKEFVIHSANDHGGLMQVLQEDEREELRAMARRFGKK